LLIAWLIKRDSDGPAFYKAEVIGKGGQPFTAFKFRSMISNETNNPQTQKQYEEAKKRHIAFMKDFIQGNIRDSCFVANESRITRVGRFLRKYSLDELPQFINVLRGEMSLVGPRFCSDTEYSFYKSWHKRRFQIKPGMTGLWQVRARCAVNYDDMVMLDLYYIQNWSLLFDLEILLRTVSTVFLGQGSRVGDEPQTSKFKEFAAKLKNDG
jgi:lipopolysaccharide/colanic/teichoic acid biosynthesis glycosyltransferase